MSFSKTFSYTGQSETYVVPFGISEIHFELNGASGGNGDFGGQGGFGANLIANIDVNNGDTLYLYVGGAGKNGVSKSDANINTMVEGGFNGGGATGGFGDPGGSGGGASDVRLNGSELTDRILVAGGGGGGGSDPQGGTGGDGGNGGNNYGQNGSDDTNTGNQKGGTGGNQENGGIGGKNDSFVESSWGTNGSLGQGGNGGKTDSVTYDSGGGGGGGYYGGGGGAASNVDSRGDAAGGGGGSSYAYELANNVELKQGTNHGNGSINMSFIIPSWICFTPNTMILTDQGEVPIQLIKADKHTILGKEILGITKTFHEESELVCFKKDCLHKNIPSRDTIMSKKHKVIVKGKYICAENMVNNKTITLVPYGETFLYNILMRNYEVVHANNMPSETLHPQNKIALLFKNYIWKYGYSKNKTLRR